MKKIFLLIFTLSSLITYGYSIDDTRLLRTPDINKDLIVFVYAGDIWSVLSNGGNATRLTSHKGIEIFPKISPDSKWIAFSGEYSGSRQIFVIPSNGGVPKQLTFYNSVGIMPPRGGYDNIVMDWTPDSKKILIRANRTPHGKRMGKYYLVNLDGGLETPLQIPEAGFGTFSPCAKSIAYTPISREFRTWKRMKGGRAQDVWIYNLEKDTSKRLTTFPGTDQHPIWYKDKIYFISDRGTNIKLNFYSFDLNNKKIEKITNHIEYDVLWPSGHNGLVVYENKGYIYKLDLNSGKTEKITANINFDNPNILPYFKNVSKFISRFGYGISPSGKRVVFDARGDIFTVPEKEGITYNLTKTQCTREMYPVWSPDGKWIAYYSDETGDYEIYLLDPKNKKKRIKLTNNHKIWKYPAVWSPDSKMLLFSDKNNQLQILDIKSKKITLIKQAKFASINDYNWSPDSKWVIYTKRDKNKLSAIWLYSIETKNTHRLIDDKYYNSSPVFSKSGKYIFFASQRDFNMDFSSFEFDFVYNKATRIYAVALTKDVPKLFEEKNDVEKGENIEEDKNKKLSKKKEKDKESIKPIKIDFNGISNRVIAFPLKPGRYSIIRDIGDKLLYFKDKDIYLYNIKEKEDKLIIKEISGCDLSVNNKKLLYKAKNKFGIIEIKPKQKVGDGLLKLKDLVMKIDPKKEWEQIYNEGWRIFRDWFYVKNMHGVNWPKMREKYKKLLPYVSHRADLDYILGELVGELNVGHTYVNWGDFKQVKRIDTGLLGADLKADKSGRYIIAKIYKGENWNEDTRSPLTEQGIDINEGDYLISLNNNNVTTKDNPYKFLENTTEKRIEIKVNSKPIQKGARTFLIKPIKSELELFYLDWVNSRKNMVEKLSNGRIGYIHVPNTANEGNRELFKGIYSLSNKDALIIDERYNGGGWSPGKMIQKLSSKIISYWHRRGLGLRPEPFFAIEGPKVMLINHFSSSGGDNFPYWFRKAKVGILIGTRTWGGLVGYGWSPGLVDGPSFAVPMSGIVGTDGEWIVEGVGIYPDKGYEVYDRPEEVAKGKDPCIEKAVEYLIEQLKKNPPKKVKDPKEPNRSKWYEKEIK